MDSLDSKSNQHKCSEIFFVSQISQAANYYITLSNTLAIDIIFTNDISLPITVCTFNLKCSDRNFLFNIKKANLTNR